MVGKVFTLTAGEILGCNYKDIENIRRNLADGRRRHKANFKAWRRYSENLQRKLMNFENENMEPFLKIPKLFGSRCADVVVKIFKG